MSNRRNDKKIGDIFKDWLEEEDLTDGYYQIQFKEQWTEVVGSFISERTQTVKFYDGKLFVELNSSSLKHELQFYPEKIKTAANEFVGRIIVKEVVLF